MTAGPADPGSEPFLTASGRLASEDLERQPSADNRASAPASRVPSLKRNFAWTLVGNVTYSACQWLLLVLLAKLGTREMVGQFAYGLAVTAPITVLTGLQLRVVQATDAANEFTFNVYFRLRLIGVAIAFAIVVALAALSSDRSTAAVMLALGGAKGVEAVSDVCFGLMQRHERMNLTTVSLIAKGLLSVVSFALVLRLSGSVAACACALLGSWLVILLAYDLPRARALAPDTSPLDPVSAASLVKLTRLSWPLGFVVFLVSLSGNLPRYFVENRLGMRELGVFSALTYILLAFATVLASLGQAATPRLATFHAARNRKGFVRVATLLMAVALTLGFALAGLVAMAGREILTVVYRPDYAAEHMVFFWAALFGTLGFASSALGCCLAATRSFQPQAPLGVVVTIITGIACILLIPRWGLMGAVFAMAISSVTQLVGYALLLQQEGKRRYG